MLVQVKARLQPAKPIQKFPKMLETRRDFFVSGTKNSRDSTTYEIEAGLEGGTHPGMATTQCSPNTVS
jgi:hypothetical protein